MGARHKASQGLRANLILLALMLVTVALLFSSLRLARAMGLGPEEQRYVMAAAALVAVVLNYWIARRLHRNATRIIVNDDSADRRDE
jgi:divalent metal cation (Fe/Co/Zn/Cd) transporter